MRQYLGLSSSSNESAVVKVPHVRQKQTWDCGIACLQMVLNVLDTSRTYSHDELLHGSKLDGQSVWSIGRCYSLLASRSPLRSL